MAVWSFIASSSTYTDHSIEARSSSGTSFTILNNANDFLYIGLEDRFDMAIFFLASNGSVGARTWEYYDGDSWNTFTPGLEYDFASSSAERFDRLINWRKLLFSNTVPQAAAPPDQIIRYWIRVSVASVATAPTVDQIIVRSYASYATADDVSNIMQLGYEFSDETTPSRHTVENYIRNAQSQIDYMTRKSWRPNIIIDEEHEFNRAGFHLVKNYPTDVLEVSIWDGSQYEVKDQGRDQEYFLVPETGMVIFSRFFILPARIQAYGAALWGWGFGEFSSPVRVSYIYGSNIWDNEREGGIVNDLAKKMAAIDVFTSHDYSLIAVSGSDKVSLERKIDIWRAEQEDKLESLRSWEVF